MQLERFLGLNRADKRLGFGFPCAVNGKKVYTGNTDAIVGNCYDAGTQLWWKGKVILGCV